MTTRILHRAEKIALNGEVSAKCYDPPRSIDMTVESWTTDDSAVTCAACRALLNGGAS